MAVLIPIENCTQCPHCETKLTKGYGYATDYYCSFTYDNRLIAGYVEWPSEIPKEPPKWCPFRLMEDNRSCASCGRLDGWNGCGEYVEDCMQDYDAYSNWIPKND